MNWDVSEEWTDETQQQPATERQIMPAGRHTMEIKHAEEGPNEYKRCDENPEGMCLKLRLSDLEGRYRFVFDDLPQQRTLAWRAKQLATALGIQPSGETLTIDPTAIIGRTVDVELTHYTSKAGKTSSVVRKYLAAEPQAPAPAAARTPAAKVTASIEPDSIPF